MLEPALVRHIENDPALKDVIGNRIYPGANLSKSVVYPYIIYQRISNRRLYSGGGDNTPVFAEPRYEFQCCSDHRDEADHVGTLLLALIGNRGRTELGTGDDRYTVESMLAIDDGGPFYKESDEDPRKGVWYRAIDIRIQHNET